MTFRRGTEAIKAAATRGSSDRRFFKWDDGEVKIVRFIWDGDQIITASLHEGVQCHDGKKRPFVCKQEVGEPCELCDMDAKKRDLGFGIAVWRDEVRDDDGRITGYTDVVEEIEIEEDGKKKKKVVPFVGIVQQGPKNFWNFFTAAFEKYGTITDREYEVKRKGGGTDTDYVSFPLDPNELPIPEGGTVWQDRYRNYLPKVEDLLNAMASDEYYDKQLRGIEKPRDDDDKKESKASGNGKAKEKAESKAEPEEDEEMRELREEAEKLKAKAPAEAYE